MLTIFHYTFLKYTFHNIFAIKMFQMTEGFFIIIQVVWWHKKYTGGGWNVATAVVEQYNETCNARAVENNLDFSYTSACCVCKSKNHRKQSRIRLHTRHISTEQLLLLWIMLVPIVVLATQCACWIQWDYFKTASVSFCFLLY